MSKMYEPGEKFRDAYLNSEMRDTFRSWESLSQDLKNHWKLREELYNSLMNPPPAKDEQTDDSAGVPTLLS